MKIIRLVRTLYNPSVYKILLVKKFKKKPVIEKLGTFNKKKKKLSLNIFRLVFWLAKKNIFICAATDEIFFQTLQIFDYNWKSPVEGKYRFLPDLSRQVYQLNSPHNNTIIKSPTNETLLTLKLKTQLRDLYNYEKNKKPNWRLVLAKKRNNN